MKLKTKLFGEVFQFESVKEVLAKANEEKSGDQLAGVAAESVTERIAAKTVLSNLTLADLRNNPVVPYDEDEVTRVIQDDLNERIYGEIKNWTVSELREWILCEEITGSDIRRISRGLTSEMVAAVTKLMSDLDLIYGAKKMVVTAHCNTTIGKEGTLSFRLQPNHPTDDIDGIMPSVMEGFSYANGDAVLGLNPVNDSVDNIANILKSFDEFKREWEIPTQISVLAHVSTQMKAIRQGAPTDLIFQSIAGSEKGNEGFGVTVDLLEEARQLALREGTATGPNVMYFETGQGAELSSDAHFDADQLTMEARCYGLARRYDPFLVNTVVGFIGPEYLYNGKQMIRAGLEDHFMGKLSGISMGVDACYTNHMKTDQNDVEKLAVLLANAGCNYFIGVPVGDDIMLNYQAASYHDAQAIREVVGLKPIKEFEEWAEKMGILKNGKLTEKAGDGSIFLK
ncbi:ethanolamine ammonia-lyase subunit EutB [Halanaerobium hydrogeniformans]|uniref:Ethanolamine ammonia-lyase large subunit n=1 Tax=Halanaerobium hydrogeniformans TaxID=656519 RepID=E4RJS9_HALHG|nr:ethanolamine ammonia-lyase subunit EutB [Halanaerobium hydrogeniformans]ADQ15499.1 Ethanolamine ammonia-lyase [Halanaerobium hydrogeniformans]